MGRQRGITAPMSEDDDRSSEDDSDVDVFNLGGKSRTTVRSAPRAASSNPKPSSSLRSPRTAAAAKKKRIVDEDGDEDDHDNEEEEDDDHDNEEEEEEENDDDEAQEGDEQESDSATGSEDGKRASRSTDIGSSSRKPKTTRGRSSRDHPAAGKASAARSTTNSLQQGSSQGFAAGGGHASEDTPEALEKAACNVVRLALALSSQRKPLRADEIRDKVLAPSNIQSKNTKKVVALAKKKLLADFGFELVDHPNAARRVFYLVNRLADSPQAVPTAQSNTAADLADVGLLAVILVVICLQNPEHRRCTEDHLKRHLATLGVSLEQIKDKMRTWISQNYLEFIKGTGTGVEAAAASSASGKTSTALADEESQWAWDIRAYLEFQHLPRAASSALVAPLERILPASGRDMIHSGMKSLVRDLSGGQLSFDVICRAPTNTLVGRAAAGAGMGAALAEAPSRKRAAAIGISDTGRTTRTSRPIARSAGDAAEDLDGDVDDGNGDVDGASDQEQEQEQEQERVEKMRASAGPAWRRRM